MQVAKSPVDIRFVILSFNRFRWAHVTVPESLLRVLLPGPVTVIFERKQDLNLTLNPDTSLIGIRIPDHLFIRALCRACAGPLALTSANVSGCQSTLRIEVSFYVSRNCISWFDIVDSVFFLWFYTFYSHALKLIQVGISHSQ